MATLENFPLISQQTKISADGSSPNFEMDCVPTSLMAAMMYLHGITALSTEWNPDKLLDMAYPEGYKGGTAASAFVDACAKLGCTLAPINGIPGVLVQHIHEQLALGHPCIVTIPDPYMPSSYGYTHVLCAYADESGYITMLDPWPGKPTKKSDGEWTNLLQFNQIWFLERSEELPKLIELTDPEIARYYGLATPDGNAWLCRQTGKVVQGGILAFYRKFGGDAYCGLTYLGLPKSNEIPVNAQGAKKQYFERAVVCYDPATPHAIDNPPGAASIYLLQLFDDGPGTDPRVASLAPLQAQVTQLQAQLKAAGNSADTQKLAQIKAIVG